MPPDGHGHDVAVGGGVADAVHQAGARWTRLSGIGVWGCLVGPADAGVRARP